MKVSEHVALKSSDLKKSLFLSIVISTINWLSIDLSIYLFIYLYREFEDKSSTLFTYSVYISTSCHSYISICFSLIFSSMLWCSFKSSLFHLFQILLLVLAFFRYICYHWMPVTFNYFLGVFLLRNCYLTCLCSNFFLQRHPVATS